MTKLATLVGILAVLVPAVWFFADLSASAQESEKKIETLEEIAKSLRDIHTRQETVEETEKATIARLCREKKLEGDDCK
jgi:hypothetical protein